MLCAYSRSRADKELGIYLIKSASVFTLCLLYRVHLLCSVFYLFALSLLMEEEGKLCYG